MAHIDVIDMMSSVPAEAAATPEVMLELGMMYSAGRSVPMNLIEAHKWFNLAASRGSAEATQLRREIAAQMNEAEISEAQRAARAWLTLH